MELEELLIQYSQEVEKALKDELQNNGRVASGKLLNSISTKINYLGDSITVTLYAEDYLKWLNDGRKPSNGEGNGSLKEDILKWIKIKHIVPRENKGKVPTEKQLAYLIARKIHREGYKGDNQAYSNTVEEINAKYEPLIQECLKEMFDNYATAMFNKILK